MDAREKYNWSRRELLKLSFMAGGATLLGSRAWAQTCVDQTPIDIESAVNTCQVIEAFPTSPFILNPFTDPMPIPQAMKPGWRQPDGTLDPSASNAWTVRVKGGSNQSIISRPGPGRGDQDALGARPRFSIDPTTGTRFD